VSLRRGCFLLCARISQVQDDAIEATIQYVVDSLPSEPLSRKLLEANNREHCTRLIVAVYTRRLETTQHFYTVSERVLSDSIYQPLYEVRRRSLARSVPVASPFPLCAASAALAAIPRPIPRVEGI